MIVYASWACWEYTPIQANTIFSLAAAQCMCLANTLALSCVPYMHYHAMQIDKDTGKYTLGQHKPILMNHECVHLYWT